MLLASPRYGVAMVLAACLASVASAFADEARIESSRSDKAVTAGQSDGSELTIESVGDSTSSKTGEAPVSERGVVLDVGVGPEAREGGDDVGPATEKRAFALGKRATIFQDTYTVSYIDEMRINEQGDSEPVLAHEEFGRWLDVAVAEVSEDRVRATVYFVSKRPVNVAVDSDSPSMKLPEADFSMVSRDVRLARGESEDLRIRGDNGAVRLRLGVPKR